jgi:peptide/nickel transport system substrate-binding protein
MRPGSVISCGVLIVMLASACQPAMGVGPTPLRDGQVAEAPRGPKRVTASITANLTSPRSQLNRSVGTLPGAQELEQLLHAGLAIPDHQGRLQPVLAEAVPTLDNGLWKVFPDGQMETTWRIREGARWQDGEPFTSADLLFSVTIARDPELPLLRYPALDAAESIEAPDARTFVVKWKQPFIDADMIYASFGRPQVLPAPKHLLERPYGENKAAFMDLPYWTEGFVGTGPFKVRSWMGDTLVVDAYRGYILGQPRIDEIEIRFIPDPNALMANILAGAVEMPLGRGLSFEQAMQVRDHWREGTVRIGPGSGIKIFPQLRVPNPMIVGDVRFRRALYHAVDRQQLSETLVAGLVPVSHIILTPGDRDFDALDMAAVRYAYDPRRALEILRGMGLPEGPDGKLRDQYNQPITVEVRSTVIDILQNTALATADDWQKVGVTVEYHLTPNQRQNEREYRSTFPGFEVTRSNSGIESLPTFHSSEARTPEAQYAGLNYPNYANPELDALIDRYFITIPMADRMDVGGRIVRHLSDQIVVMPVFYDASPTMAGRRVGNVPERAAPAFTVTWNVHQWDVIQ